MIIPKISIGSWAFAFGPFYDSPWSFEQVLDYAARAGFEGIGVNGFSPHPNPDIYDSDDKCKQLRAAINARNLKASEYAPDFSHVPPSEVEADTYIKEFRRQIEFCNKIDSPVIRVDTVTSPQFFEKEEYNNWFLKLTHVWRETAKVAFDNGIKIVWEFEPGFWLNKPSEIVRLVEEVNHQNFLLLFDTSHAHMVSQIGARQVGNRELIEDGLLGLAKMMKGEVGHLHLIDSDKTLHDNETSTHALFGDGCIDFESVIPSLVDILGPLEWWTICLCFNKEAERGGIEGLNILKAIRRGIWKEKVNE